MSRYQPLPPFDVERDELNCIVETPRGSRYKYAFNETYGVFRMEAVLPAGSTYPYDFGYIPGTVGEDGDPLDVLLLMEDPAFPGCLVPSRLLGVLEVCQTERDGRQEQNDRLVAVAADSRMHRSMQTIDDLDADLREEIVQFFQNLAEVRGRHIRPLGWAGPDAARKMVDEAHQAHARKGG